MKKLHAERELMSLGILGISHISLWDTEGLMGSLVASCLVLLFTYSNLYEYLILTTLWPRGQGHAYYPVDFVMALHFVLVFLALASPCLSRGLQTFTVCLPYRLAWG